MQFWGFCMVHHKYRIRAPHRALWCWLSYALFGALFLHFYLDETNGEIGAPDGVSDRTVSRAIAKSVKQILEYGKLQVLLNRIGMNDVTPGDVIFLLANYLAGGTIKLR